MINLNEKNSRMKDFIMDEDGQGMVEYGLILGLIALICVTTLSSLGNTLYNLFFGEIKGTMETINKTN